MGYRSGTETKSKIFHAAIKLFTHHGYYKTTMRMIAAEAEVNLGLCTYHFKTKDNIVKIFYRRHVQFMRNYVHSHAASGNLFTKLLSEIALNYSLLFSSRLLLTLFLEGITADDLSRIYPGGMLKEALADKIPSSREHDDTWYLMGSVILSASARALMRKWRERVLPRTTEELTAFFLHQICGYFKISGEDTAEEIRQILKWTGSQNFNGLEKDLLQYCLSRGITDLLQE